MDEVTKERSPLDSFLFSEYEREPTWLGGKLRMRFATLPSLAAFVRSVHLSCPLLMMANSGIEPLNDDGRNELGELTILGFGSLLSLKSARLTFPSLKNFRYGRVPNHRRVFSHPASIFFQRGIANLDTLEISSLSCEYVKGHSFVCSVFEVADEGLSVYQDISEDTARMWIPSQAFLEREEEFEIAMVPYDELTLSANKNNGTDVVDSNVADTSLTMPKMGLICRRSTDEAYISLWGKDHFERQYLKYGVQTIWNWSQDSGLRPCPIYLRHCVLASRSTKIRGMNDCSPDVESGDGVCYSSFLDETYLIDRETSVRKYLSKYPAIMNLEPPEELRDRYGG